MPRQRPPFMQDKNAKTFVGVVVAIVILIIVLSHIFSSEKEIHASAIQEPEEMTAAPESSKEQAAGDAEKSTDSSGSSIQNILVSDHADLDGYVEEVKTNIPETAEKIFATAEVVAKADGHIQATLEMPDDKKMGPNKVDITGSGNILKAFSFVRGKEPWPKGEYTISVLLSTGAKKTIKFKIP